MSGDTIAAGYRHHVYIKTDGTVWSIGLNADGQLGDGSTANRNTWGQVGGIANARYVAAGDYHTAVLKADGTVWTFGDNAEGQIGDGTTADRPTPCKCPA